MERHYIASGKPMQNAFVEKLHVLPAPRMQGISVALWMLAWCVLVCRPLVATDAKPLARWRSRIEASSTDVACCA